MARSSTSFKPGVSGNPSGRAVNRYRKLLRQQVTDSAFVRIVDAIIEAAVAGDMTAAKLILAYAIGTPQPVEPEAEDAPAGLDVARLLACLTDDEVSMLLARMQESEAVHAE